MIETATRINKKYLLHYIKDYLVKELQNDKKVYYNDLKTELYNNDIIRKIINKKKNISVYLDNLLKYDIKLKKILAFNDIAINNGGFFQYKNPMNLSALLEKNDNNIKVYNEEELNSYFCPYINLIIANKQKSRVSFKPTKTNERVLNLNINKDENVKDVITYLKLLSYNLNVKGDNNIYYITSNGKYVADIEINDTSVVVNIEKVLKKKISNIKKIYPFNYFSFFNIYVILYLMNEFGFEQEAKYISFKLLDIVINKIEKKYFIEETGKSTLLVSNLFNIFYKDKIQSLVYDEYTFISEFYRIFNDNLGKNFVSFLVGQYKLYIYLKNKYNREIRNIAVELYENKNRNLINKIIRLSDFSNASGNQGDCDLAYEETISYDDVLNYDEMVYHDEVLI